MALSSWWTRWPVRRMARPVNLLLLLSALLSALTGGVSAMRAPTAAHTVASAAVAVHAEAGSARIASRPQQGVASLTLSAVLPVVGDMPLIGALAPLYASRRRE